MFCSRRRKSDFRPVSVLFRSALILAITGLVPDLLAQGARSGMDRFDVINIGLGMSNRGLPILVELEQTLDEHISAGIMASYQSFTEGGGSVSWQHQYFGAGVQGHYHFVELVPPPFDFFAGLTLGWFGHNFKWAGGSTQPDTYTGNVQGGLQLAGHIGGRYTYKDWTLFTQLTGGTIISGYTFGLSIPLK